MTPDADRELLERILREGRVDTRVEPPSWAGWLSDLVGSLLEGFAKRVGRSLPDLPAGLAALVGWLLVALLLSALALLLARFLASRRGRGRAAAASSVAERPEQLPAAALDWRSEAGRRLAAGQPDAALEAAWWWFATAISSGPVDAAWTTREVLARSRRVDLEPLGRKLDISMYGSRRPGVPEVAVLLKAIERAAA